jgi:hypothetical protein
LQFDPLLNGAEVVAEMELAGRPNTGENTRHMGALYPLFDSLTSR